MDVSPDLERLSRLNRLGHFKEAVGLFEERLAVHVDLFPVTAEYVDLLLEQGNFGALEKFISNQLEDSFMQYSQDEVRLLKLLKSLTEIHTRGPLIPALQMTTETIRIYTSEPSGLRENPLWSRLSIGIQVGNQILLQSIAHFFSDPAGGSLFTHYHVRGRPLYFPTQKFFQISLGMDIFRAGWSI